LNLYELKCVVMLVDLLKKEEASMIDSAIEPNGMNKLRREVDSYGRKEVF
jgi:hypothetical protein